ncbi:SEP-domain-containing protein [Exidia glandulosa HHB12029]|uniref:SEP-domain-containing protein n=1 Tax=Exidia glandulosa HHB12029 TaxID=1314781 RepID=A0A165Q7Q9_EXIGL|nr:SEP-domain-containing protein [Exidia glandulosa HHB12029]
MSDNDNNNGGRSLGGGPAEPMPAGWGAPSRPRVGRVGDWNSGGGSGAPRTGSGPRIATLGSLGSAPSGPSMPMGPPGGHGHAHDDDDEDDEDDDEPPQSFFAGGERSALSVEGPGRQRPGNSTVRDILRKAAQATQERMGALGGGGGSAGGEPSRGTSFFGGGHTLGSDEVESQFIPDPDAPAADEQEEETAIRQITFWRDGFSVEDGPLMRYDDPQHARLLNDINTGHAPPSILNVRVGQPVELRVLRRLEEEYVAPVGSSTFAGSGNRLGAAIPGDGSTDMPGTFPGTDSSAGASSAHQQAAVPSTFELDTNAPTTSVQIRLADGSRLVARMNLTHTVRDLRNYINASHAGYAARPYTLATTFPNRVLENDEQTIKDAGLANSVIVHRWV